MFTRLFVIRLNTLPPIQLYYTNPSTSSWCIPPKFVLFSNGICNYLIGTVSRDFCFRFFSWITFPQAPENNIRIISNFLENYRNQRHRRQMCHRCCWHRWPIMGTISGCRHLKVNLKAKIYIYMLTLLPKGVQSKLLQFFFLKIFSICHRWKRHRWWCTLSREYLCELSKKFEMAVMLYSCAWGELIHEKTRSRKSRDTVPLTDTYKDMLVA